MYKVWGGGGKIPNKTKTQKRPQNQTKLQTQPLTPLLLLTII